MRHWYYFIVIQKCGREFYAERYCRKKDLDSALNHLAIHYNAETIRYFRRGKNYFEKYGECEVIQ